MKILITGSSQGIGKKIFEDLKEQNEVYTINRTDTGKNNFICDLSNLQEVQHLCNQLRNYHFDVLINNAGGSYPKKFEDLTVEDITKRINLNFISPLLIIQSVVEKMKINKFGRIINISSVAAKTPVPYLHIYSSAKSALNSLTKSLAKCYKNLNITINSICPGAVETNSSIEGRKVISKFNNMEMDEYQLSMINSTGLGRLLDCSEISNFVQFLISDKGSCFNGQSFNICGLMEVN